jgi:hypothetical protein
MQLDTHVRKLFPGPLLMLWPSANSVRIMARSSRSVIVKRAYHGAERLQ